MDNPWISHIYTTWDIPGTSPEYPWNIYAFGKEDLWLGQGAFWVQPGIYGLLFDQYWQEDGAESRLLD